VARQTRAERRARRQQAAEPALAGAGGGGDKPPVALAPEPPSRPERGKQPAPSTERGGLKFVHGVWRFFGESWGELRKTEWPSQNHVIQGTVVVLMACIILGTFIWLCDIAFKHLVQDVLIK
jgi:preprotein translocase subunit SecE